MVQRKKLPKGISRGGRDGKSYIARISVNGTQYYLGLWPTLTDAKTALQIAWGQKAAGTFIPPAERRRMLKEREQADREHAMTVRQYSDVWVESLERNPDFAASSLRSYRSALNAHILPTFGDTRLIDVTPESVDAFVEELKNLPASRGAKGKASNGIWVNVSRVLRTMFNAAVEQKAGGLIESPVTVKISPKRDTTVEPLDSDDVATPEQVRALADAMPDHMAIAVHLAAWCALRLGEVLGLQRRDFLDIDQPDNARVRIARQWNSKTVPASYTDPKYGSKRTVAIPASLVPLIVAHLDTYTPEGKEAPFIPSKTDPSKPVPLATFGSAWRDARKGIMKPGYRFHDLRHTGLTVYGQQGATLAEIMARGGHRDQKVALRYQHASVQRDRALTSELDRLIEGQ